MRVNIEQGTPVTRTSSMEYLSTADNAPLSSFHPPTAYRQPSSAARAMYARSVSMADSSHHSRVTGL